MKASILFLVIFISAICPVSSRALSDENNLLIEHLDKALDRTEEFAAVREQNISKLRLSLKKATTDSARLEAARSLFEANKIFDGDSAMYYGNMCLALAKDIRRPDMQDDINIMSAYTLAAMGLFDESRLALSRVRVDSLSVDQMIEYLGKKVYLITHIESYHRLEGNPATSRPTFSLCSTPSLLSFQTITPTIYYTRLMPPCPMKTVPQRPCRRSSPEQPVSPLTRNATPARHGPCRSFIFASATKTITYATS